MDNNVLASKCFDEIIDEIKECGFSKGAKYIPPNEYDIAFRNLCEGFKLGEGRTRAVFNDRAYIRRLIGIYDQISERLVAEEKGKFYTEREKLGLLFSETATKEGVIEFHGSAKNLYDKYFKKGERMRIIDFNQGLDGDFADEKK